VYKLSFLNTVFFRILVMKSAHVISLVLVVIGAINWGLVGLFQFDLVAALFGGQEAVLSRIVYTLVGIAGIVIAVTGSALLRDRAVQHRGPRVAT
jgi:hypothetical protein